MQAIFPILLIITFVCAVGTMFTGIATMGRADQDGKKRSNKLMFLRVGLCIALLLEILIYAFVLN